MSTSAARNAALAVSLGLALTACGSGASATAGHGSGDSLFRQLVAGYVADARCARAHGMPNLPDPQVDEQGNAHYPALDRTGPWGWPQSVIGGCEHVWARLHAIRDRYDNTRPQRPASPATFANELRIARCIRTHGFPTYPDPSASGGFVVGSLPPGFSKTNISPPARAAIDACTNR
jgi:hypothetical protein